MKLLQKLLGHCRTKSPWLFHMNSGSCNGCDIELIASITPRYDVEQYGVHLEGSPRHADILCISGPVTHAALPALLTIYNQVPKPKAVIAIGSCAATCNVFAGSPSVDGPLCKHIPVDVFVPGCPPRPDAIVEGVIQAAKLLGSPNRHPLSADEMQQAAAQEGGCCCAGGAACK